MNEHLDNFKSWYIATLERLYPHRDAGFAILMIAFPLLERYLRKKVKLSPNDNLSDLFYAELALLFPVLSNNSTAKDFWQVYRNGLLHEVTLSQENRRGNEMPVGWVSHDKPMVSIEDRSFWIHPVDFTIKVIETIQNDFKTFEGVEGSISQLPRVKHTETKSGRIILGTNTQE
jgi:hypothetical protein